MHQYWSIILLHLLLYVAKGLSSRNICEKWTILESNFITLQGILNHTFEAPTGHSKQPFPSYSGSWIRATTSNCRTIRTSNVQDVRLQRDCMTVVPSALQNILRHVGACEKPNYEWWGKSTCRANQVMGLPLTIFHDMWIVLSNA